MFLPTPLQAPAFVPAHAPAIISRPRARSSNVAGMYRPISAMADVARATSSGVSSRSCPSIGVQGTVNISPASRPKEVTVGGGPPGAVHWWVIARVKLHLYSPSRFLALDSSTNGHRAFKQLTVIASRFTILTRCLPDGKILFRLVTRLSPSWADVPV